MGGFGPNILSLLVLIEIRIRSKLGCDNSGMGPSSGGGLIHIILINILFTMTFLGVKAPQPLAHVIDYFRKRLFSGRLPEYKNYFPENKKLFFGIF